MIGLLLHNLVYRFVEWRDRPLILKVDVKQMNRENR